MYKFLAILLFLAFAAPSLSFGQEQSTQENINQTIDGKKQGFWIVAGKNGKTDEGHYVDGKKDGKWTTKAADGTVRSIVTFVNGIPKGEATYYYPDGSLMESGIWNIDHWEGGYSQYYESGAKKCEFTYNNKGHREGEQKYYHENGKVMMEGTWTDGKITSTVSVYDENGNKTQERHYDENGKSTGVTNIETPAEGKQTNTQNSKSNTTAQKKKQFNDSGTMTLYNKDGKREQSGEFVNGKLINGERYFYNSAGKLVRTEKVKNGKTVSATRN